MDDKFTPIYDADFLVWTEQQAKALRQLAKHRALLPNELDLEHVIEEIEDLGRSELAAVKSQIRNIMIHLIKAACDGDSRAAPHWAVETRAFHGALIDRVTPAIRARLELQKLWERARRDTSADLVAFGKPSPDWLPMQCPYAPDDFIKDPLDFATVAARLTPPA